MFGWSGAQEADFEWSVELSSGEGSASSPLVRWRGAVRWDMELSEIVAIRRQDVILGLPGE
jgi:hypothetical protein